MRLSNNNPHHNLLLIILLLPTLTLTSAIPPISPDLSSNPASNPAIPEQHPQTPPSSIPAKPLPLLIWHGLGDRYDAEGLRSVGELAQKIHPGTYIHYISAAGPEESGSADRTASFLGNVSVQIDEVCGVLKRDPRLWRQSTTGNSTASLIDDEDDDNNEVHELRVDALGFSQGGQFLRGLLQRCAPLSIRSLVTFGSQHNGIAQFQSCGPWDFVCKGASALIQDNVWTDTVQNRVVPAQYFREVNASTGLGAEEYVRNSHFLADINNENFDVSEDRREGYKRKVAGLEKFVMVVFENDTTVIPKESGWFADVNLTSGEVTSLRERRLYTEDWLGLRELDEKGGLVFRSTSGRHMALDEEVMSTTFKEFFGPEVGEKVVLEGRPELGNDGKGKLGRWWRFWRGCWARVENGSMVAPPEVEIGVPGVPKEGL